MAFSFTIRLGQRAQGPLPATMHTQLTVNDLESSYPCAFADHVEAFSSPVFNVHFAPLNTRYYNQDLH